MPSEPESKVRDLMQALGDSVERAKAKRAAVAEPPELGERCSECGLSLPGPHRGTCSMSLMSGGPGYGQVGGDGGHDDGNG
jgi:hypothetical protein